MANNNKHLCRAISLAILGGPAMVQQALADAPLVLEEVVVTAQKTVQLLQDVPVTVNAITGDTFQRTVSFDLQDLGKLTPGLHMIATGNNQNVTLRGVGTGIQASQSPRTNIYFDGSYVPNAQLSFYSQFDIARFEVLRGPQGTLYSKTSPTGTIIVHSHNPDLFETEGYVQTTFGQHDLSNTEFGISIPIVEGELGLRIAGLYDENNNGDQFYETLDKDVLSRTQGGRATLIWDPAGAFDTRISHTYLDVDSNVGRFVGETDTVSRYDRKILDNVERGQSIRINQTILELNWDMDWAMLSSQSYYAESANVENALDQDSSPVDEAWQRTDINFNKLFNTELRLASTGNEFWDWIAGVYYASTRADTDVVNVDMTLRDLDGPGPGPWLLNRTVTDVNLMSGSEDWGIFTHNTFYLADDWSLTVGVRWSDERRQNSTSTSGTLNFDPPVPVAPGITLAQAPYDLGTVDTPTRYIDWTGTVKLSYQLNADQMLYATYDRGGRSGGQTLDLAGTTPRSMLDFAPESSNSFELGYKSDLLGGRMRFNASVYYQIYKDFHVQAFDVPIRVNNQLASFDVIVNAREAISSGAEIDLTFLFTENLRGGLAVAYNDTKYEDFDDAPCDGGDPAGLANGEFATCDLSGQRTGGDSGNWSVVANGGYTLPIATIGSEWYLEGLFNFNSFRIAPDTRRRSASYATVDIFTGLRSMEQTWDIKLWVKNVFDKEATIVDNYLETRLTDRNLNFQPPVPGQATEFGSGVTPQEQLVRPRQIGITGTYRF